MTAQIIVNNLHKYFGPLEVLKGINLEIEKGQVVCVIGPSGSGKSTLLRCINRLEEPTHGDVTVDGIRITDRKEDINKVRRHIGMVFQQFNLFPHLSAKENIMMAPLELKLKTKQEAEQKAVELLERVGLSEKVDVMPRQLSGGQQQRVAIARAIVTHPKLLLADEPTGSLDSHRSVEIMKLLQKLNDEEGITVVLVTHEPDMAKYAKRIVHFVDGTVASDQENKPC